jgi:hypothetical protein
MNTYTVVWKGQKSGPFSETQLRTMIESGEVRSVHTIFRGEIPIAIEEFIDQKAMPAPASPRPAPRAPAPTIESRKSAAPVPTPPPPKPPQAPFVPVPRTTNPDPTEAVPRPPSPPLRSAPVIPVQLPTFDSPGPDEIPTNRPPPASPQTLKPKTGFLPLKKPASGPPSPPAENAAPNVPPPPPPPPSQPTPIPQLYGPPIERIRTSGLAVASLVLGVLSVFGGIFLFVVPVLAVIFGHVALGACHRDPQLSGRGMAVAGLVLGWICLGLIIAWIAFVVLAIGINAS